MSTIAKISQLDTLPQLTADDLLLIVDSGSMTTYTSTVQSFGNWMAVSGSSSFAPTSVSSSFTKTASLANSVKSSSINISGSYAVTTSVALNLFGMANFVSYSLSSSWASSSISSSHSISASYLINPPDTFAFASYSLSSSWASQSLNAENVISTSFATNCDYAESASVGAGFSTPGLVKAWAYFTINGGISMNSNKITASSDLNYNVYSMSFYNDPSWLYVSPLYFASNYSQTSLFSNSSGATNLVCTEGNRIFVKIHFTTPLANTNYNVIGHFWTISDDFGYDPALHETASQIGFMRIGNSLFDAYSVFNNVRGNTSSYYNTTRTTGSCIASLTLRNGSILERGITGSFIII